MPELEFAPPRVMKLKWSYPKFQITSFVSQSTVKPAVFVNRSTCASPFSVPWLVVSCWSPNWSWKLIFTSPA